MRIFEALNSEILNFGPLAISPSECFGCFLSKLKNKCQTQWSFLIGTMWWSRVLQLQKIHLKTFAASWRLWDGIWRESRCHCTEDLEFIFNSKSQQLLISIHDHICEIGSLAYSCNCAQQDYLEFEFVLIIIILISECIDIS